MQADNYFDRNAAIYDDQIRSNVFWHFIKHEEVNSVLQEIQNFKNKTFLDLGAGTGVYSSEIKSRGGEVTCVDSSKEMCTILQTKGLKTLHSTIENFSSEVRFDFVLLIGCTEFQKDFDSIIAIANNHLKAGGKIILLAPPIDLVGFVYKFIHNVFMKCPVFLRTNQELKSVTEKNCLKETKRKKGSILSVIYFFEKNEN